MRAGPSLNFRYGSATESIFETDLRLFHGCEPGEASYGSLVARLNISSFTLAEASLCTWGPKNFEKGQARELKCDFQAPVHEVYWYKNNELITNGTEGLYQSYDQLDDYTLRSTLRFPTVHVHHEGIYTCKADTNQNSSCPEGLTVEVSVFCKCFVRLIPPGSYAEPNTNPIPISFKNEPSPWGGGGMTVSEISVPQPSPQAVLARSNRNCQQ